MSRTVAPPRTKQLPPRIQIQHVEPLVDCGRYPVKRTAGESVDVYASIFKNLKGIKLVKPDAYARFNTGRIVYHDDWGDYSTNEYIMDGTASLAYLLATLDPSFVAARRK